MLLCLFSLLVAGVAACFVFFLLVVGVRGGFFVIFVTACLTCECHADKCGCSMHPLWVFLFSVPSSCPVACRRSELCNYDGESVHGGARVRLACAVVRVPVRVCLCTLACFCPAGSPTLGASLASSPCALFPLLLVPPLI